MNETTAAPARDRATIRAELEATLAASKDLVGEIGAANWKLRSAIPEFTCGQLAWHLASSLNFIAGQIEAARNGKALNPPAFVAPLLFKANELRVRLASRNATPASVTLDLESGMTQVIGVFDETNDVTLARTATAFFDEPRTIAEMFSRPTEHFTEHAEDIRQALAKS